MTDFKFRPIFYKFRQNAIGYRIGLLMASLHFPKLQILFTSNSWL